MLVPLGIAHLIGFSVQHGAQGFFNGSSDQLIQVAPDLALIDAESLPLFSGITLFNGFVVSSRWLVLIWFATLVWRLMF